MDIDVFSDEILELLSTENDEVHTSGSLEETVDALIAKIPDSVIELCSDNTVVQTTESVEQPAARSEFKQTNAVELQRLIAKNDDDNTKRSTNSWIKRYQKWATE